MKFNCVLNFAYVDKNVVESKIDIITFPIISTYFNFSLISNGIQRPFKIFFTKNNRTIFCNVTDNNPSESHLHVEDSDGLSFFRFKEIISDTSTPCSGAIWYNEDTSELFVARDYFGSIPLYYIHIKNEFLAISTDIFSLLQLPKVKRYAKINPSKISQYLSISDVNNAYSTETFYLGVNNILPSHITHFTIDHTRITPYASYNPSKWKGLSTIEEYGDIFRDLFRTSVNNSIQNQSIIGSHLSGGMDSSCVIATAKFYNPNITLHSFFFNTESAWSNESEYALTVANHVNSNHHILNSHTSQVDYLIKGTAIYRQPQFQLTSGNINELLIEKAKEFDCEVLLTGHDGDSIVGYGREYLQDLYNNSNWAELDHQFSNQAQFDHPATVNPEWGQTPHNTRKFLLARSFFYFKLIASLKKFSIVEARTILTIANSIFNIPKLYLLRKVITSYIQKIIYISTIPSDVRSGALSIYISAHPYNNTAIFINSDINYPNLSYLQGILYNQNVRILEEFHALGMHYDINIRHPYFHPALYEFSLAVPSMFKFNHGIERGHQREAMKGILPEQIRTRTNKSLYNDFARNSAISLYNQSRDFLVDQSSIWKYVDQRKFNKILNLIKDDNQPSNIHHIATFYVNRTIFLAVWLDQAKRDLQIS